MKKNLMKKFVATGLVLTMVAGGGTAAFANGNDHGRGNNKSQFKKIEYNNFGNKGYHNVKVNNKTTININLNFKDMNGAQWALRYIASLANKGVFEGYEDGTFKPNDTVKRIDALAAAVRNMGLREQAESDAEKQTKLNFADAKSIPAWAVGYVAVALENDLFAEGDANVNPMGAADRLWATTLLVKSLGLEAEAKAKMNEHLTFKDANKIPAGSVGYIAVAIEKGLIDGFEDNTFRPNQPVTRAQLAALLDRTSNEQEEDESAGTLSALVANNVLTLTKGGVATPYTLHPDVFVWRDGVKVSPSALQVGDEVQLDAVNNVVTYIEVTKLAQQSNNATATSGTITAAVYNNEFTLTNSAGTSTKYTVGSNTVVYRDGVQVPAVSLQVGDVVSVQTTSNNQIIFNVTTLAQNNQAIDVIGLFNGTTFDVQGKIATISINNNGTVLYTVSPNVVISGDLSQLVPNQNKLVQVRGYNGKITQIEVK